MRTTIDRPALTRVVAVINGKGGVGKTTLTANVGGLLAVAGWRVLLVDLDPRGDLGLDLGYRHTADDDGGKSLAAALLIGGSPVVPLRGVRERLDVWRGGAALRDVQNALAARGGSSDPASAVLARELAPFAGDYDIVLIDCSPSAEALQMAALGAARWVIVPARADPGSREGLADVADVLRDVLPINAGIDLLGVALFDIDTSATRKHRELRDLVAGAFEGDREVAFETMVRHSINVSMGARGQGKLVHELEAMTLASPTRFDVLRGRATADQLAGEDSAPNVSGDLHSLTSEIVARITKAEEAAAS